MIYGLLLGLLVVGYAYAVTHRSLVVLDVLRDRTAMYHETEDGLIENVYTIRLINKDSKSHSYKLSVTGIQDARIVLSNADLQVPASEVLSITLRVIAPAPDKGGSHPVRFNVISNDQQHLQSVSESRFFSPM